MSSLALMRRCASLAVATAIVVVATGRAGAGQGQPQAVGGTVAAAAAWAGIAPEILGSVVWVESAGWPWALNIQGVALYPRSRADAVVLLRAAVGRADIGLAQIHYPIWGRVFGLRPEDLLDPWTNLHVAAVILRHAMDQEPESWGGVGRYHSATPWRKWWYARRVATVVNAFRGPALLPGGRLQP